MCTWSKDRESDAICFALHQKADRHRRRFPDHTLLLPTYTLACRDSKMVIFWASIELKTKHKFVLEERLSTKDKQIDASSRPI